MGTIWRNLPQDFARFRVRMYWVIQRMCFPASNADSARPAPKNVLTGRPQIGPRCVDFFQTDSRRREGTPTGFLWNRSRAYILATRIMNRNVTFGLLRSRSQLLCAQNVPTRKVEGLKALYNLLESLRLKNLNEEQKSQLNQRNQLFRPNS